MCQWQHGDEGSRWGGGDSEAGRGGEGRGVLMRGGGEEAWAPSLALVSLALSNGQSPGIGLPGTTGQGVPPSPGTAPCPPALVPTDLPLPWPLTCGPGTATAWSVSPPQQPRFFKALSQLAFPPPHLPLTFQPTANLASVPIILHKNPSLQVHCRPHIS